MQIRIRIFIWVFGWSSFYYYWFKLVFDFDLVINWLVIKVRIVLLYRVYGNT